MDHSFLDIVCPSEDLSHMKHFSDVSPLFMPLFQFPALSSLLTGFWALHVQLQSAPVLFRSYDLPVVSRAQGGSLISTGTAVLTGSLSVLSSAEGLCLRE